MKGGELLCGATASRRVDSDRGSVQVGSVRNGSCVENSVRRCAREGQEMRKWRRGDVVI